LHLFLPPDLPHLTLGMAQPRIIPLCHLRRAITTLDLLQGFHQVLP
jgi:hypothetical protein